MTNEVGRDRVKINSTPFKNESLVTVGNFQFTANYREDGKLMVARRDLTNPVNDWDILVTEFTSYNINDSHNVPVIGIDGDGYLHLAWGTHNNPLLYTRSTTPLTGGQALSLVGQATGNSGAINTMTGTQESQTTYPNFIRIPGSDDLLFNYRTGGSGNGTYRITRWNDATDTWTWADEVWIKNTDASGLTYNAYPHNLSYDSNGGLHASWTYRYNSSSPTGNSGFQTNHNLHYAYSPDDGVTWYKDINGTIPYPANIDESNSQVIVPIPEGSSLINTGTQAIDANDRAAIATWWAPRANDPVPDHRRQYMYVGHDGSDWFTSQITHRRSDPNTPVPESHLGVNHMGRPQIVFDDYNRAFVFYKDNDNGGGVTVAYSQAESRDDWEFIKLTTENLGNYEPTLDRALWESTRQAHLLIQTIDGNSSNGGSALQIVEWDAASALGRVLKWTGQSSATWDGTGINFTDLGTPTDFDDFDNVTFDNGGAQTAVNLSGNIDARKVVVDSTGGYVFAGPGALTSGSLSVVGGGSLELATSGNTYTGPTRVSNATLLITGDATAMTSMMIVADGGTLVMDSTDASTMTSAFEIWSTGTLQIGTPGSTTNVFPDNPTAILNDGLIRVYVDQTLEGLTGQGTIEAAGGTTTLQNNAGFQGGLRVMAAATAVWADSDGLGSVQFGDVSVEDGGQLRLPGSGTYNPSMTLAGSGGGAGALQIGPSAVVTLQAPLTVTGPATAIDTAAGASATINSPMIGAGGLAKQGPGELILKGNNTYSGPTIVRGGLLIIDQSTGFGDTSVEDGGILQAHGTVRGNLNVLGGGVLRINATAEAPSGILFQESFAGGNNPLHGTAPDVAHDGSLWIAAPTFQEDGDSVSGSAGGSATLGFMPTDGAVYTLETSIQNIVGDSDWFALGFTNGQSSANSTNARFITDDVVGLAWAMYRGTQSGSTTNSTFLGSTTDANGGIGDSAAWLIGASEAGGSVAIRITLDTTGGTGAWTAMMEADTGTGFQVIRAAELLNDETINAVGFANSNAADLTGRVSSFTLTTNQAQPFASSGRTLSIAGDALFETGSTLELQIAGAEISAFDQLDVAGSAQLSGTLDLHFVNGYAPELGESYIVLQAGQIHGGFDLITNLILSDGQVLLPIYDADQLALHAVLAGDADADQDVDQYDLNILLSHWGGTVNYASLGDWSADGRIDAQDLAVVLRNWTSTAAPVINIPEPSTSLILAVAGLGLCRRLRRA